MRTRPPDIIACVAAPRWLGPRWPLSFLLLLLVTGWSAALRDWAAATAGQSSFLTVVFYVVLVALLSEAIQLPLAFYQGVTLERRYELSTQTTGPMVARSAQGGRHRAAVRGRWRAHRRLALLRWNPEYWWLVGGPCFAVMLVVLAHLAPVLLLPLFYTFKPLQRPALAQSARCAGGTRRRAGAGCLRVAGQRPDAEGQRRADGHRADPSNPAVRHAAGGAFGRRDRSRCSRTSSRTTCTTTSGRRWRSRRC